LWAPSRIGSGLVATTWNARHPDAAARARTAPRRGAPTAPRPPPRAGEVAPLEGAERPTPPGGRGRLTTPRRRPRGLLARVGSRSRRARASTRPHHRELLAGDVAHVGPSQRVCSRPTFVSTATSDGMTFVASQRPPSPASTTATSTPRRANSA
jgi:hypothetical protein